MAHQGKDVPVRIYQSDNLLMLAAPMPGLEPENIQVTISGSRVTIRGDERGPGQHRRDLFAAEWTIGPYYREVELPQAVDGALANASYGNGVLSLAMPKVARDARPTPVQFQLQAIESVRGERVAHSGRAVKPAASQHAHRGRSARGGATSRTP